MSPVTRRSSEGFDPRHDDSQNKGWLIAVMAVLLGAGAFTVFGSGDHQIVAASEGPSVFGEVGHDPLQDMIFDTSVWDSDVRRGALEPRDTFSDLLERLGTPRGDSYQVTALLGDVVDMRRLRVGTETSVYIEGEGEDAQLVGLTLKPDAERSVVISRDMSGRLHARELGVRLEPRIDRIVATIDSSIYNAALAGGAGDQQVVDFASIFAYDIDFQRDIQPGDQFEILYERMVDERGQPIKSGNVLFAALDSGGKARTFYRYTPKDDGITDYFDENGESARKFLMKSPINGARLSSNFGMRRHPILGYSKMHAGIDFAAPTGTPILAAGNGTIVRASRFGSFGNYILIRHANGYETAYAHLSGYAKGIRAGAKVRQGQVIGYVGSTGRSTGPHLHYEVIKDGKKVNPLGLKLPTGRKLDGGERAAFEREKAKIDALRESADTMPAAPAPQSDLVAALNPAR